MSDPANLKTIGQFILLGDASLHPCSQPENVAKSQINAVDATGERKAFRVALASTGQSIVESASLIGKEVTARSRVTGQAELLDQVRKLATQRGMPNPTVTSYHVSGGKAFRNSAKTKGADSFVTVAVGADGPDVRVLVAHSLHEDDKHTISFLRNYVSR